MSSLANDNIQQQPQLFKPGNAINIEDDANKNTFSLLSYNILLPNSVDGWWTFKNYCPVSTTTTTTANINNNNNNNNHKTPPTTSWKARQLLLKNKIKNENPHIICLQEASDVSYKDDFDFLIKDDKKWDYVIHNKGKNRMRPITFWRKDYFQVINNKSFLKDQTIITPFQTIIPPSSSSSSSSSNNNSSSNDDENNNNHNMSKTFWVINCHLKSGTYAADRRLRQIHEAMETIRKKSKTLFGLPSKKNKKNNNKHQSSDNNNKSSSLPPVLPHVIIAGDFNSTSNIDVGTGRYLLNGIVKKGFSEYGKSITSKDKINYCGQFLDAYQLAYTNNNNNKVQGKQQSSPPTLIAPSLIPRMEKILTVHDNDNNTEIMEYHPTNALIQAIKLVHTIYADVIIIPNQNQKQMSRKAVEQWLYDINKSIERGDEMRHAFKILNEKPISAISIKTTTDDEIESSASTSESYLTSNDLLDIYVSALRGGKYWSIAADLYNISKKNGYLNELASLNVLPPFYIEARNPTKEEIEQDLFLGVLDYIFFTPNGIKCNGVMDISTYKHRPIPDSRECSDHFALKASFTLL